MNHVFLLSTATSALVGLALMLAWRRDPAQDFSRDLGFVARLSLTEGWHATVRGLREAGALPPAGAR